jgi:hypothetical protein
MSVVNRRQPESGVGDFGFWILDFGFSMVGFPNSARPALIPFLF